MTKNIYTKIRKVLDQMDIIYINRDFYEFKNGLRISNVIALLEFRTILELKEIDDVMFLTVYDYDGWIIDSIDSKLNLLDETIIFKLAINLER